jgi:DNA polymerase-3 subunit beta
MKATIERATLLRCLSHVQSVVERRNTIPILSNVLIEAAAEGSLKLMATDLDLQVVESLPAVTVDSPGAITVSAHLLFDIARKLPDGSQVSIETADNRMTVKAGRSRFSLPTLPRDDFPMIVEGDLPTSFEVPAKTLAELIDRTRFAISTEETRYYLNGIFLHVADEELKAAATDGHRLARFTLRRPDGAEGMPDVIVPRKCVAELRKLIEEALDTNVQVDLSASKVRFTLGGENGVVLTSKLIDGTFPDYSRVIPTGNDKLLKLDPRSFFQGVDRVRDDRHREDPRGQDGAGERQGHAVGDQPGQRHRRRGDRRRLCVARVRDRLQRQLPQGHPQPDRRRHGRAAPRRRRRADADPPGREGCRAVRADADAGLIARSHDHPYLAHAERGLNRGAMRRHLSSAKTLMPVGAALRGACRPGGSPTSQPCPASARSSSAARRC